MFFMFLTHMSNFVQIGCYLRFDQWTYFFYIILDHKNLKSKHLIDDITIDLWFSWNFASILDIIRTCNPMIKFSKFTSNKKILAEFEEFLFKLIWRKIFSHRGYLDITSWEGLHHTILKSNNKSLYIYIYIYMGG